MLGGIGFSVASLAITLAIWYFSDDALQTWCERCAFGKKSKEGYNSSDVQEMALDEALLDVM